MCEDAAYSLEKIKNGNNKPERINNSNPVNLIRNGKWISIFELAITSFSLHLFEIFICTT